MGGERCRHILVRGKKTKAKKKGRWSVLNEKGTFIFGVQKKFGAKTCGGGEDHRVGKIGNLSLVPYK